MRSFGIRGLASVLSLGLAAAVVAPPALAQERPTPQAAAAQAEAKKLSDGFVAVADRVSPAVVQIDVTSRDENADQVLRFFGKNQDSPIARGTGSGVVFTSDGAILTNNHVIDHALTINVRLRDGRLLSAKLLGRDPATDLAVIKVDATGLTAAKFADSDAARVGEWVVAIGSPFGLGYTVTTGVLSAKGRGGLGMNAIEDYLQTDASINPGNSGGPLCDLNGNVLGINTMIVGRGAGIGFAVPANLARRVAEQILKKGKVERAWIGVGIQDLTPELASALKLPDARAGVLVNSITDGGPAQKANIKPGDVIAGVGGKKVTDGRELVREVIAHEVGQTVALEIIRDGKRYGSSAVLTARPEAAVPPLPVQQQGVPQAGLGLSVRDLNAQQAAQLGLPAKPFPVVTSISPGSAADRAGLKTGDVVIEADGVSEPSATQLAEAAKDGQLLLRVRRRGDTFYVAMKK
ncbi:MAG: trypsin-like peptidase domain-containing protein [Labilithrix sp.]|nr:trypsin-like peptidase domain-containing protein [Labilithrix sp.]MCW5831091.1 trypsin-like peptidase domain-containing protein [Labilithrix sp.]